MSCHGLSTKMDMPFDLQITLHHLLSFFFFTKEVYFWPLKRKSSLHTSRGVERQGLEGKFKVPHIGTDSKPTPWHQRNALTKDFMHKFPPKICMWPSPAPSTAQRNRGKAWMHLFQLLYLYLHTLFSGTTKLICKFDSGLLFTLKRHTRFQLLFYWGMNINHLPTSFRLNKPCRAQGLLIGLLFHLHV